MAGLRAGGESTGQLPGRAGGGTRGEKDQMDGSESEGGEKRRGRGSPAGSWASTAPP